MEFEVWHWVLIGAGVVVLVLALIMRNRQGQ